MRELVFDISEPFQRGLRPQDNFLNREGFLEECFNLVPTQGGLEELHTLTDPFQGGQTIQFPFPQVFRGRDLTLMFESTAIHEIDVSALPWTKTTLTTVDTSGTTKTIAKGGVWHYVDLGPTFYAFNGNATVFRPGLSLLTDATTTTYVNDSVTVKTGCTHRGRVFVGGFDKSNIWDSDWGTLFAEWEADIAQQEIDLEKDGPGPNWVMWSTIGGGDFPLWLFWPKGFSDLGLGVTKDLIYKRMERNEFGWSQLKMPGEVVVMKPLGDNVIVYGTEGIEALQLQGENVGFRTLARFGVMGRGAVSGNLQGHVFLDKEGNMWTIGANLNVERLGFGEWLVGLDASSTVLTSDSIDAEFYISDPSTSYVLNQQGLAEHDTQVTSTILKDGTQYAVGTAASSTDIRVKTGSLHMQRQALKMIHNIQVDYSGISNLTMEIQFRNEHKGDYTTFGPTTVNPTGVAYPMLTARDFKIRLKGTPLTNPRIDKLEVRWNLVDKRAVRGQFVS